MSLNAVRTGVVFTPDLAPEKLREVARAADGAGLDQLWLWEDCFKESGVATAAAALAWTENIAVGVGLLPVPLRNVALTAMEIATLARLFPGRFLPGVGHGVLDWMGQVGARAESPMTLLREYVVALRSLLHGATVTTDGRYVNLDAVALDWPPADPPELFVGAIKPRTSALAGELADGVIFTGDTSPTALVTALEHVEVGRAAGGLTGPVRVAVFPGVPGRPSAQQLADVLGAYAAAGATEIAVHNTGADRLEPADFVGLVVEARDA